MGVAMIVIVLAKDCPLLYNEIHKEFTLTIPSGTPMPAEPPRTLDFGAVFSIAAGAMISSGLFVLPAIVFAMIGPAIIPAYALAALLYIPTIYAKAELATAMPRSGGSYMVIAK